MSWDAVADADFYDVYYDDFFGSSCTVRRGSASFCEELATNVAGTLHAHQSRTATTTGLSREQFGVFSGRLVQPGNDGVRYPTGDADGQLRVGRGRALLCLGTRSATLIFNVYYDDFFGSSCTVRRGSASFCEELATNITTTSYTHTNPDPDSNYYWVRV